VQHLAAGAFWEYNNVLASLTQLLPAVKQADVRPQLTLHMLMLMLMLMLLLLLLLQVQVLSGSTTMSYRP
jgi:hypothetical protein